MPKKSPKPARKVSEPRAKKAKKGSDIPHPPIEASHSIQGKAAETGKDAAKLPAEEGVAFPYSFELVASTALHFLKQGVERNSAVQDAIRHLDDVSAILPSLKEEWCHNQRFWQAVERAEDLGINTGGMQAAEEKENDFLRGVGHITGTRKGKDIQPFRRFLCLLSRTDDSLGTAILGLVTQPLKIPLISRVSVEQRRKICESPTESRAEKEEIDEWICNFRRGRFESMMLTILKNAFERLRQLETAYQNSIKGALGGRGNKGGLKGEKTRGKKVPKFS